MLRHTISGLYRPQGLGNRYTGALKVLSTAQYQNFGLAVLPRAFSTRVSPDVAASVQKTIRAYDGDSSFLAGPTDRTLSVWGRCKELHKVEIEKGILDLDAKTPSTILSHSPGYIDQEKEKIVGLQTDAPLKRSIKPYGGVNLVAKAASSYGYTLDPATEAIFRQYRVTHNDGVFAVYTPEMMACRKSGIITGLPDAYGRGRIIGDYRRVALYGVDALIAAKEADLANLGPTMSNDVIQLREEVRQQITALKELVTMAKQHGDQYDISRPATSAQEAIQWTYFAYLAAIKQQDGAAMSIGRLDAFFDDYIERDIESGVLTEAGAQELIDDFVIKLRLVRHLRPPEYNDLFAGDPQWVTLVLGGCNQKGDHMVTKTSYRFLQTLHNLGPAPEPNITVLWSDNLPQSFKDFCTGTSIATSSIQYENDALMRECFGSDYGIACCVSGMQIGKEMQFFGARANLAKLLLYALNKGRDEISGVQIAPLIPRPGSGKSAPLVFDEVWDSYKVAIEWLAETYVNAMNCIHYMHDKYDYESLEMALHDTEVKRSMAFGMAGLSVVADSLSAIKHASVTPVRDERGIATAFDVVGDYPCYGNDDARADELAQLVVSTFMNALRQHKTYRDATHTLSILTITSNVVYGRLTGDTPDGRVRGEPFAPGANPMHGRDSKGALASLNSVASIPYDDCKDGISNTFSIVPSALGKNGDTRKSNLGSLLDGYFEAGGHHLNVNVLDRETLLDAVDHPEKYPHLTIRVSGYAVNFVKLTHAQQMEVISRTFHESLAG